MVNTNLSKKMKIRGKYVMTGTFLVLFGVVVANFFKISVLDNAKYQEMANDQHFGSITISAHRGSIYDAKGAALARSASVYKVFLDPKLFKDEMESLDKKILKRNADKASGQYVPEYDEDGNEMNVLPESTEKFREQIISMLSSKLGITADKIRKAMEKDTMYEVLQDQVEKTVADEIVEFFNEYGFNSVNQEEDTKRYYPQNELAASVIGFTNSDGDGVYGIEAYYDDYLAGIDGCTISAKDSSGSELPYKYAKTYPAQNGNDVYLTIDTMIQHYLEKYLKEMVEEHQVKNRGCAILMNAKSGAVYGMATYPSYDLNEPQKVADPLALAKIAPLKGDAADKMTAEELEKQRKNKCVTEIYEPGSVFKVITSASAFEEDLIEPNHIYNCIGYVKFSGVTEPVGCHLRTGHGNQTYQEALTHSCNPAFMEIGQALGIKRFQYYYHAFGLNEPTGIDLPAEITGIGFNETDMSDFDLAMSSIGQANTVTPMEMITSYCAAINGGYLLQPYVVDKVVDEDGNIVLKNERTVRRQVVSEDTSAKMREALYNVVKGTDGSGNVSIKGYTIGGKSGTSERRGITKNDPKGEYNDDEYGASFVCFTPAEDPELILLVLADMPDTANEAYYGGTVAAPVARKILTDVLPYLGFSPTYTDEELKELDVIIPLLEGSVDDAKATLAELGVEVEVVGNGIEVIAQSPTTGSSIAKGGKVYLFTDRSYLNDPAYMVEVPAFEGVSGDYVRNNILDYGINYVANGASIKKENSYVAKQSIEAGKMVLKGTSIELEIAANTGEGD